MLEGENVRGLQEQAATLQFYEDSLEGYNRGWQKQQFSTSETYKKQAEQRRVITKKIFCWKLGNHFQARTCAGGEVMCVCALSLLGRYKIALNRRQDAEELGECKYNLKEVTKHYKIIEKNN